MDLTDTTFHSKSPFLYFKAFSHMLVYINFSLVLKKKQQKTTTRKKKTLQQFSRVDTIIASMLLKRKQRQPDSNLLLGMNDEIISPDSWLWAPALSSNTTQPLPSHQGLETGWTWLEVTACCLPVERKSTMPGTE